MKRTLHKALSMLLAAAMVFNMGLTPVFAEGIPLGASGLTECHTEHDEDCGYTETITMGDCIHEHDGNCGYTEGTAEQPCTFIADEDAEASPSDATVAYNEATHSHDENCGYAPATEGTPCNHKHDDTCGYIASGDALETTIVTPCTHTCEVCAGLDSGTPQEKVCTCEPTLGASDVGHVKDCPLYTASNLQITDWQWVDTDENLSEGVLTLPGANAEMPAMLADVTALLPQEIMATIESDEETLALIWACETYPSDGAFEGNYIFTATLPQGYALAEGVAPLEVPVELGGVALFVLTGNGTKETPYLVTTFDDLKFMADSVSKGINQKSHYKLTNDIDCNSTDWTKPIGNSSYYFQGVFDGDNYVIKNFKTTAKGALFGEIQGATIKNLGIEIVMAKSTGLYDGAGGVAGAMRNGSTIENCFVTGGSIAQPDSSNSYYGAGGIVGTVYGVGNTISNCYVNSRISGCNSGGIVGLVYNMGSVILSNCYAAGAITDSTYGGGIVGRINGNATCSNCVAIQSTVIGATQAYRVAPKGVSNVHGYEGMLIGASGSAAIAQNDTTASGANGANATRENLGTETFYSTTVGLTEGWTTGNNKLPILSSFGPDSQSDELPAYLAPPLAISGTITNGAGGAITFNGGDLGTYASTADGDGAYSVSLPAGAYAVLITCAGKLNLSSSYTAENVATNADFTMLDSPVALGGDTTVTAVFSSTDDNAAVQTDDIAITVTDGTTIHAGDFVVSTSATKSSALSEVSVISVTDSTIKVQISKKVSATRAYLLYKDTNLGQIVISKTVNKVKLSTPADLVWNLGKATWTAVPNAGSYIVQLYKDGTAFGVAQAATIASHDFTNTIAESGTYKFTVIAKASNSSIYNDSIVASSGDYAFSAQTLATVKDAADAALHNMTVTNDTTDTDVMTVVTDIITNGRISAAWSAEPGKNFTLTPGSVGDAVGAEGSITGTIVLTMLDGGTTDIAVSLTIAPLFTATFTGGYGTTGTAPSPQENLKAGAIITLPANPFRISGKAFTGWSDGTSTYASGATYTVPNTNVTFTAQWSDDVWDGSTVSTTLEGQGTEAEPYLIYNSADFAYFQGKTMPHAKLMADIDLGDKDFTAMKELSGTFNGNNCTIRNLNLAETSLVYTGLFQQAGHSKGACIQNLTIEDAQVSYSNAYGDGGLGILVGQTFGQLTVSNCYVTGTINSGTLDHACMGGLIGDLNSDVTIENCYAGVTFTGTYVRFIGGLVGYSSGSGNSIQNSFAIPTLSMTKAPDYYGGIMGGGSTGGTTIAKCYAAGQSLSLPGNGNISGIAPSLAISDSVSIFTEMGGKQRITSNRNVQALSNNYGYVGTLMRDYKGNILTPPTEEFAADKAQGSNATTKQLESQTFYQNTLSWDFDNTWKMDTNYKYPVLQGQTIMPNLELDMTQTVKSVTLDKTAATLAQKGTLQLTATVDITNGASREVIWSSSDSANTNLTVDQNGRVAVREDAVAGIYTITATSTADGSKFASCTITVNTTSYNLTYMRDSGINSPNAIAAFYATADDAQNGRNPVTTAKSGTTIYVACTNIDSKDVVASPISIKGTDGSTTTATRIDKYRFYFVMPCADTTVTVTYAEDLNAYNYVWFVGQDWSSWGTTATYTTKEWDSGLGYLKVTDIINGKQFERFDIKSVSLYNGGSITLTENKNVTNPSGLADKEYCILYDESGLPTMHVRLTGPGTIILDIETKDDPSAVYRVLQDSTSNSYFTLDKTTARAGEKVTATLTAAAVESLTADKTGKTKAALTYYGGLLVVPFPPVFTLSDGTWSASFDMPAQDITTKVYFSKKTEATLTGTDKTVEYNGTPQTINSHITIMIGNTDASDALNGQYEVIYCGINGTSYAASTAAPTNVGIYSCTVKFQDKHPLYSGIMADPVMLNIEKSKPKTPAAPLAANRTETSITLTAPTVFSDGTAIPSSYTFEYCRAGFLGGLGGWQVSPVFDGLSATTSYSFCARIAENDNSNPSDESAATTVATLTAAPAVSCAQINYTAETVSCGELYEISSVFGFESGEDIQSGSSVTGYIGKTIYIRVKAANGQPASRATAVPVPNRPTSSTAPVIDFVGETLTVLDTTRYKINEGGYADGSGSPINISGEILTSGSTATVTYYLKATDSAFKSAENTMEIPARPAPPAPPTAGSENIKDTSITLTTAIGCEYSKDGITWNDAPKFENLNPNTEYTFYQRVKATTNKFASAQISSTIKTTKQSIETAIITLGISTFTYNGNSQIPTITVKMGETTLVSDHYEVSYFNSNGGADNTTNAGTVTVTVTAKADGNYSGTATNKPTYMIGAATPTISWGANTTQTIEYTGNPVVITPPTVTLVNGETYNGDITYTAKASLFNLFGLFAGESDTPPSDVGEYEVTAHTAAFGNYKAANSDTMTLTIEKVTSTLSINSMAGKIYDGTAVTDPTDIISNVENPTVTYTYYLADGVTKTTADNSGASGVGKAPVNAGDYKVTGTIAETDNTMAVTSAAVSFTIAQVSLTVTGGEVAPKQWDGNTNATVNGLTFSAMPNGESLVINTDYTVGSPTFDSAAVGDSKTVKGTATLVQSAKTNNYALAGAYTLTNGKISLADGPAAPTNGVVNDDKGIDTYTFHSTSGVVYEYRLNRSGIWTDITANSTTTTITVGNIAVPVGELQVRVKETATHQAGEILSNTTAFTPSIEGSVAISGTAAYGETLTATASGTQTGAELHYLWKAGTETVGTDGSTYTIEGKAVGKAITVEVTAEGYNDNLTAATAAVQKKAVTATAGTIIKVYDGTNAVETADQTLNITKVNNSDDITVTMPDATYDSAAVSTGKTITVGDLSITGSAKDWYTVTAPSSVTGSITAKPLSSATVEVSGTYTYTGTAQTPAAGNITVKDGDTIVDTANYDIHSISSNTDAGEATVSVTLKGNYSGLASGSFTIDKAPLTITGYTAEDKDYDGTTDAAVSAVTFTGLQNSESLTLTTDYTLSAQFDKKDADTAIAVTGTVTLVNSAVAKNYSLESGALTGQSAEIKPIAPAYSVAAQNIKIGWTLTAIQASKTATGISSESVSGTLTWADSSGGSALPDSYVFTGAGGNTKTLYWTFTPDRGNYKVLSGSTIFTLTEKEVPVLTVSNIEKTYDGKAVTTVTGTAKVGETPVAGTFAFEVLQEMKNADTYHVTVKFTPTDSANYKTATTNITVVIQKAALTVKAEDKQMKAGAPKPSYTAITTGLVNGETITDVTFTPENPDTSTKGTYTITPAGGTISGGGSGNYNITYETGTLTISVNVTDDDTTSSPNPAPNPPVNPTLPTQGEVKVTPTVDKDGNATLTASEKDIADAIKKAQEDAKKKGTEKNGIGVVIQVNTSQALNSVTTTLTPEVLKQLIDTKVNSLTIKSGSASITFDLLALIHIHTTAGTAVTVSSTKINSNSLSAEAQKATGGRPVYDFKVMSGSKNLTTFGDGRVTISIPYKLQKVDGNGNPSTTGSLETPGSLVGVYVDEYGKVTYLPNSSYHAASEMMLINTPRLSVYGVAYKTNASAFTDTVNHWAKDDISFVVARGLLTGTADTAFSPDSSMTRGMFVTAIGRMAGADVSSYKTSSFSDVAAGSYYLGYVEWAVKNNITNGVGDGKFAPDQSVSRQEMAVMLSNYAKASGYKLPIVHAEIAFTDQASIGTATRAEASAILRRFVELVANSGTAILPKDRR